MLLEAQISATGSVLYMKRRHEQIILRDAGGLEQLAVYLWRPRGEVRGVVQIIHGMREHMGRYDDFAAFLCTQGYAVCGHDQMGHGRSGNSESAFGYFGEKNGTKMLVRDCYRVTRMLQREFAGLPLFLLGHSMGSLIGRLFVLHHSNEIAGFICMGTSGGKHFVPVIRAFAGLTVKMQGSKMESKMLDKLTFLNYNRRFSELSKNSWLSRDKQSVERYEWDALIRPYLTTSGYRDLYDMQLAVSDKRWFNIVDKTLPMLILSGAEDPLGDYGKGVVQVYERLKLAGALDVECKLYEGARHELLHEINREEVYYDIYAWMQDKTEVVN